MRITYDPVCGMGYIYIQNTIAPGEVHRTVEVANKNSGEDLPILIDLDKDGKILGIEVFGASRIIPQEALSRAKILPEIDVDEKEEDSFAEGWECEMQSES